jgi:hypothetical protein
MRRASSCALLRPAQQIGNTPQHLLFGWSFPVKAVVWGQQAHLSPLATRRAGLVVQHTRDDMQQGGFSRTVDLDDADAILIYLF